MSGSSRSSLDEFGTFSRERAELLQRLLESRTRQAQQIRPRSRGEAGEEARLPVSWAQQRLWFIDQVQGSSAAYHVAMAMRLRGELDRGALELSLDDLVDRHEVLRTVFVTEAGEPWQRIVTGSHFAMKFMDLSGAGAGQEEEVARLKIAEVNERFDLCKGPLIRGRLLRLGEHEHVLLVTMHHIISDGWSMDVFINELMELYGAHRDGRACLLKPLPVQYADYAQWQRHWLQGPVLEKQLSYWRERLRDVSPQLELPTDRPRPGVQSYRGKRVTIQIDAQLSAQLKALAQRHEMTLFMVLLAGWAILMSRLSGQDDVAVGTPVANRQRPELGGLIGFFVNTLVLRVDLRAGLRLDELLEEVKTLTLDAYEHQDLPFDQVVEAVRPQRSLARNPLFQTMLVLQNAPTSELRLPGLAIELEDDLYRSALFDLLLSVEERADRLVGNVTYAADLFDHETVGRWLACFEVVLRGMTGDGSTLLSDLPLLPEAELHQILAFNATQTPYPAGNCIHDLFEEQARHSPHAIAVSYGEQSLTYGELNARANQLAFYLRQRGVQPDQLVGILIERGIDMVVALLGILKAGGAYVPLDPDYPIDRLTHMLRDASPAILITQTKLLGRVPNVDASVIALDRDGADISLLPSTDVPASVTGVNERHLAYVIYTSGSSGTPKGAMVEHAGLCNLAYVQRQLLDMRPRDRVLQFASLSFDACIWECTSALCHGAKLCLASREELAPGWSLLRTLQAKGITHATLPPVALGELPLGEELALTTLIVAGEACPPAVASQWIPRVRFFNGYGPTEATVCCTMHLCGCEDTVVLPLGRPLPNMQVHVLDRHRQIVPLGVTGEIYIGGAGVGRGYLNRPDLTSQRFVHDPFEASGSGRLYRTGDLGRWRGDGTIEYLGRNDDQVKIRGFRIELGEVEAQLGRHAQVKDVAVVVREDVPGEKRLVAYFTLRNPGAATAENLRAHLRAPLPDHMVPSAFVELEEFPLTPNGKLDRRSLPRPGASDTGGGRYEPPQGITETLLGKIWERLLHVDRVGRYDNFFELGGHSLHSTRLIAQIADQCAVNLSVVAVFEHPTIKQLADLIDSPRASGEEPAGSCAPEFDEGVF